MTNNKKANKLTEQIVKNIWKMGRDIKPVIDRANGINRGIIKKKRSIFDKEPFSIMEGIDYKLCEVCNIHFGRGAFVLDDTHQSKLLCEGCMMKYQDGILSKEDIV